MVNQPQANPAPHPIDYMALALALIGGSYMFSGSLPPKYAGPLMAVYAACKFYTKLLGSRQDRDALQQGEALGQEIQTDLAIASAKKAEPVN
jgi:hypothetical protein